MGHPPSPHDTRHLRAYLHALARVRAKTSLLRDRGWPPDWTNSSNRTYTLSLSLSLSHRENPFQSTTSFRSRTGTFERAMVDWIPFLSLAIHTHTHIYKTCSFTADFTVSDIRFQLIGSPPSREIDGYRVLSARGE